MSESSTSFVRAGYHHGSLRRTLLDTARELIEERGTPEFSLREIAKRSQVSATAPFRHFKSKDDLVDALIAEGYKNMAESFRRENSPGGVARAYVQFAELHPTLFRLMTSGFGRPEPTEGASQAALEAAIVGIEGGVARPLAVSVQRALAVWCVAHGFATLRVGANREKFSPEVWPDLEAMVEGALRRIDESRGAPLEGSP